MYLKNIFYLTDKRSERSYVLEGGGQRPLRNTSYLRAILAFAVYVKELCHLLCDSIGRDFELINSPGS